MELNKELISSIASGYGLSAEDLTAKLTSNEPQELKLAGQLFTEKELSARDSGKFNEGKTMMSERIAKDFKQKYGYELDGVKDFEKVLEHHNQELKTKYSKGGNERVAELESDISDLKKIYESEIEVLKTTNSDFENKYRKQATVNKLLQVMPKETAIKPDALITLFNSEYEIAMEEGVPVVKQNGITLKDAKTTAPLGLENVFNDWVVRENYTTAPKGRGGSDEFGLNNKFNGLKTPEEFQTKWQETNPDKNVNSPEYQKAYSDFRTEQKKANK